LDPYEVFETLPEELKRCFESQDIPLLQEAIKKLPPAEAAYHMKRCVDSGLWVPDANSKAKDGDGLVVEGEDEEEDEEDGDADAAKAEAATKTGEPAPVEKKAE